jgi:flagellar L-ring protein precursor FlgH
MRRHLAALTALGALALGALAGCSEIIGVQPGYYPPAIPAPPVAEHGPANGAIYQATTAAALFDDVKARNVGDTLTIRLSESTQASKSATTGATKDTSIETAVPSLLGTTLSVAGKNVLSNSVTSKDDFQGKGSSSQSNSLSGNITVTVTEVYPNGNLLVRGEKWLTLNQGEEFVQITGIVRAADIATDNSVPSSKIADARITYSGNGAVADSTRPGWLTRMLIKLWPL